MKLDGNIGLEIKNAGPIAAKLESLGYAGGWSAELSHDPFLPIVKAIDATENLELGTNIAVAFSRNPMLLANLGWDLQEYSGGRFILGLDTQIKTHITKRFGMPWVKPVQQMREFIEAVRAIWTAWETGEPLRYEGEIYRHTLMTPAFTPSPHNFGRPPIYLAAVGPAMVKLAAEAADGYLCHGFVTPEYLRDVSMPAYLSALEKAGRKREDMEVALPAFTIVGDNEEEIQTSTKAAKAQLAFYGSTPSYRVALDHHGWGDAHLELNKLSKQGKWEEMSNVIDDDILTAFSAIGTAEEVADQLIERFGDMIDRVSFYGPVAGNDPDRIKDIQKKLAASQPPG